MIPFRGSASIFRVGRTALVWNLPEWAYAETGHFDGRWDDPSGIYRVRYASFSRLGAMVEALQRYRPDFGLIAGQKQTEGEGTPVLPILSRFAPEQLCVALFEGRHSLEAPASRRIRRSEADFRTALNIHRINFAPPMRESAAAIT